MQIRLVWNKINQAFIKGGEDAFQTALTITKDIRKYKQEIKNMGAKT